MGAFAKIIADDNRMIAYRPRLGIIAGSVTATILLQQILYYWESNGGRAFYKFNDVCEHKLYRPGDSWQEILGFTYTELNTARSRLGTKLRPNDDRDQVLANNIIIFWRDKFHTTWYEVNPENMNLALEILYTAPDPILENLKLLFQETLNSDLFQETLNRLFEETLNSKLIRVSSNRINKDKKQEKPKSKDQSDLLSKDEKREPANGQPPAPVATWGDMRFGDGFDHQVETKEMGSGLAGQVFVDFWGFLETQVYNEVWQKWLSHARLYSFDPETKTFYVATHNRAAVDWINGRLVDTLQRSVAWALGADFEMVSDFPGEFDVISTASQPAAPAGPAPEKGNKDLYPAQMRELDF